jgi:hypothetical protein
MNELASLLATNVVQVQSSSGAVEDRIKDTNLATRIGTPTYLKQPSKIRAFIKAHWQELSKFGEIYVRNSEFQTSMPQGGTRLDTVAEYYLNRNQSLYVVAKSDSPAANELTVAVLLAFDYLQDESKRLRESCFSRFELTLREEKDPWKRLWDHEIKNEFLRMYGYPTENEWPLASLWLVRKVYDLVLGEEVANEMRRRAKLGGGNNCVKQFQFLNDKARKLFEGELQLITGMAISAKTPQEFLGSLETHYSRTPKLGIAQSGRMQQAELGFAASQYCENPRCRMVLQNGAKFCQHCGRRQKHAVVKSEAKKAQLLASAVLASARRSK